MNAAVRFPFFRNQRMKNNNGALFHDMFKPIINDARSRPRVAEIGENTCE